MKIVDAHHHLWERGRFRYSWLHREPALNRDYLLRDYQSVAAEAGVARSVFVQADTDAAFGLQEARWALSLADAVGPMAAVVAWAPIAETGLDGYLDDLGSHPRLKGVRWLIQGEPDPDFCARPEFVAGVRRLAGRGLSFDVCVHQHQLPAVLRLVRQVPEVSFVLDHVGKPDVASGQLDPWRGHIRELASCPNLACKMSGVATEADHRAWTVADLRPYLDHVIDTFGCDRLMFGSDWPVCTLAVDYARWLEIVRDTVRQCPAVEQERLFSGTAEEFYRLPPAES